MNVALALSIGLDPLTSFRLLDGEANVPTVDELEVTALSLYFSFLGQLPRTVSHSELSLVFGNLLCATLAHCSRNTLSITVTPEAELLDSNTKYAYPTGVRKNTKMCQLVVMHTHREQPHQTESSTASSLQTDLTSGKFNQVHRPLDVGSQRIEQITEQCLLV